MPIAIGGAGGSGTRLIAMIIKELGYYIGNDLNPALDNLFFSLLFRRKNILLDERETVNKLIDLLFISLHGEKRFNLQDMEIIRSLSSGDRHNFSEEWLKEREHNALQFTGKDKHLLIGWKEPNTHIVLHRLLDHNKALKYIHVIRNGLDMALSKNQNQLMLWGDCFLNKPVQKCAIDSLKYWNAMHTRLLNIKKSNGDRILILNYDKLCSGDLNELEQLFKFIGVQPSRQIKLNITGLIKPSETIGRHTASDFISEISDYDLNKYRDIMSLLENSH